MEPAPSYSTPLRLALSHLVGWLADRRVPRPLRAPLYRLYARSTGADLAEARPPLDSYASLGAFFVRRLVDGARPLDPDPGALLSPVDGKVHNVCTIEPDQQVLEAKGRRYSARQLLAGIGEDVDLEGGIAWTIYLGPKDYHRIHAPLDVRVTWARWVGGARLSVAPKVLARRTVLPVNERCVLRLESERGPLFLVLVGALNVGRIRVVGVPPTTSGHLDAPREFERGSELARFELGSTIVLLAPAGLATPAEGLEPEVKVRLGRAIGALH